MYNLCRLLRHASFSIYQCICAIYSLPSATNFLRAIWPFMFCNYVGLLYTFIRYLILPRTSRFLFRYHLFLYFVTRSLLHFLHSLFCTSLTLSFSLFLFVHIFLSFSFTYSFYILLYLLFFFPLLFLLFISLYSLLFHFYLSYVYPLFHLFPCNFLL